MWMLGREWILRVRVPDHSYGLSDVMTYANTAPEMLADVSAIASIPWSIRAVAQSGFSFFSFRTHTRATFPAPFQAHTCAQVIHS